MPPALDLNVKHQLSKFEAKKLPGSTLKDNHFVV